MITLSVVTVTHNSSAILESFLAALALDISADDEVIIVDSGSSDLTETTRLAELYGAQLIACADNIGYGAGSNLGRNFATSAWLAIVNPDVAVTMAELRLLADEASKHNIQCIGPQIIDATGAKVATARSSISPPWRPAGHFLRSEENLTYSESISGSCMVIDADWFDKLNGFDEYFFMFCEEIDFHKRLLLAGGHVGTTSMVTVRTPGGGSSSTATRRWAVTERSVAHVRYIRKHFTALEASIDLLWRCLQVLRGGEFSPRSLSLKQLISGAFEIRPAQKKS